MRCVVFALQLVGLCGVLSGVPPLNHDRLKIGAFNIKWFGRNKMRNPLLADIITKIVERYDIILIQEVRDRSNWSVEHLLKKLNNRTGNTSARYLYVSSPRLGRTHYKETYVYFYRSDRVHQVDTHLFSEQGGDVFEREPFCLRLTVPAPVPWSLALIGLHARPDSAVKEIRHLSDQVEAEVKAKWNTQNILYLGDLNADCAYASGSALSTTPLFSDPKYLSLIGSERDTTTGATHCAYDRIVATGSDLIRSLGPADIYFFDKDLVLNTTVTENVSDHYPVEVDLNFVPTLKFKRLRIGAFNIKWFGKSKMKKPLMADIITKIVERYDVILIQEVRDRSNWSVEHLLKKLNNRTGNTSPLYSYVSSPRLGRKSYKESYVYFYRSDRVHQVDTHLFSEQGGDVFEREPFCLRLTVPAPEPWSLALIGLHARPDSAVKEIRHLSDQVEAEVKAKWNTQNLIYLGNLNADCSYASASGLAATPLFSDPKYSSLIGSDQDTTTGSSDCAYDRIVATGSELVKSLGQCQVYLFDKDLSLNTSMAKDVSDHYPVEVEIVYHS